jgi:hypothetical protein
VLTIAGRFTPFIGFLALILGATPIVSHAQRTPDLRPGNFELGLYGGASYGVDAFRPMGGVNLSYSLPKLLLPYVEFSYFPELLRNLNQPPSYFQESARLIDFHGGVHIRILPHEARYVPYAVFGFGVLNSHTTGAQYVTKDVCGSSCSASTLVVNGTTYYKTGNPIDIKSTDPTVNLGAGLRIYHTSSFGYRAEFKAYRPVGGEFTKWFSKTEGGIFFQFGGK